MVIEVHDAWLRFIVHPPVGFLLAGAVLQASQDFHHTLGRQQWWVMYRLSSDIVIIGMVAAQCGFINGFAKLLEECLVGARLEELASGIGRFEEAPLHGLALLQQGTVMRLGGPGGRTVHQELQDHVVRLGRGELRLSGRNAVFLGRSGNRTQSETGKTWKRHNNIQ